jgi:2-keto-3-deoxy-L-fuconate dehydrogenase
VTYGCSDVAAAFQAAPEFKAELTRVPLGRLAKGREDALFALFLASDESDFFVGQSISFCGGWAE